ncbi:SRPBCC family protein [Actinomadura algeriensis]|uniref:Membrane protein n=1 Tax=Actinomadura algeriensis TaxID=1679523 RepID=A0ABR9JWL1_9ACTN|nr:SRPBCC family protein [Actinomadura algeriensis]MBE1534966.1 putative membrane protein [Actinomadura algeriensis]
MRFEITVDVAAPPERVWSVMADVERLPDLTPSMDGVELLDGPLRLSARARVRQPRLATAVWTVTEFTERESFAWESRAAGVTTTGGHFVRPAPDGGATLRLTLVQTGPLAPVIGLLFGRRARAYVTMEAHAVKKAAEAG